MIDEDEQQHSSRLAGKRFVMKVIHARTAGVENKEWVNGNNIDQKATNGLFMPKVSQAKPVPVKTLPEGKPKKELGFEDNKTIPIKSIAGIDIKIFRSISNQQIKLGSQITVLSGRNGSLKTSLRKL